MKLVFSTTPLFLMLLHISVSNGANLRGIQYEPKMEYDDDYGASNPNACLSFLVASLAVAVAALSF